MRIFAQESASNWLFQHARTQICAGSCLHQGIVSRGGEAGGATGIRRRGGFLASIRIASLF